MNNRRFCLSQTLSGRMKATPERFVLPQQKDDSWLGEVFIVLIVIKWQEVTKYNRRSGELTLSFVFEKCPVPRYVRKLEKKTVGKG